MCYSFFIFAGGATNVCDINFSASSIMMTGKLMYNTAFHSARFSGVITNRFCCEGQFDLLLLAASRLTARNGTYRIIKCRAMLSAIAPQRYGLTQGGRVSSDSFSESELRALNISIVTSTDSEMVVARLLNSLTNISQPI